MRTQLLISIGCILSAAMPIAAQEYPGCEARPEITRTIHDELSTSKFVRMKWSEQEAIRVRVLSDLMRKYPREIAPQLMELQTAQYSNSQDHIAELRKHYRELAAAHPDDAVALVLAARALYESDTPESIRLAEAAHAKAPKFPYPSLLLANIYADGLRADAEKSRVYLNDYYAQCPASTDREVMRALSKIGDTAMQASIAKALRQQLASVKDPLQLEKFNDLWSLEFRVTPPAQHDALRKQVAQDVKRLEAANPKADASYWNVMLSGYKQSGPSSSDLTAFENRVLAANPGTGLAFRIVYDRWKKDTKEPESQTDRPAWRAYNKKLLEQLTAWDREYPTSGLGSWRLDMLFDDENLSEKEGVAALEAQLAHQREWEESDPSSLDNYASMLLDKKWRLERAVALLDEARPHAGDFEKYYAGSDNLKPDQRADRMAQVYYRQYETANIRLRAALLMHKPEIVDMVRAEVEAPPPADLKKSLQSRYWRNRALLAELDQHQADALAYFQTALQIRPAAPQIYRGKLDDGLMDESKDLWKRMGGTETAFAQWSAPPSATATGEPKQGRWEKPSRALPSFELSDLSGKTWKLKSFEGKTILINLWATWCGPCQAELPEFQKLYEKVKDRPDLQVVSFNIDAELGLVAPFMKEKGYTFPALIAYDFARKLLDDIAIPQNWIVDQQGKWQVTQLGYGGEPDWVGEMIKRMESTKAESPH